MLFKGLKEQVKTLKTELELRIPFMEEAVMIKS